MAVHSPQWKIRTLKLPARPMGVTVDALGRVFISEFDTARVSVYDSSLNRITDLSTEDLKAPHHTCFDRDHRLYIVDYLGERVLRFDLNSMEGEIFLHPSLVKSPWQVKGPCAAAFDHEDHFLLVNYGSHCVAKFSKKAEFLGWIGQTEGGRDPHGWKTSGGPTYSSAYGGLDMPNGITVDNRGMIFIADSTNHRIQRFGPDGKWRGWLGSARGENFNPEKGFREDGLVVYSEMPEGFCFPLGITTDNQHLYVTESGAHRIRRFSMDGRSEGWMGSRFHHQFTDAWENGGYCVPSTIEGGFCRPYDIAVRGKSIFVADTYNERVQEITEI